MAHQRVGQAGLQGLPADRKPAGQSCIGMTGSEADHSQPQSYQQTESLNSGRKRSKSEGDIISNLDELLVLIGHSDKEDSKLLACLVVTSALTVNSHIDESANALIWLQSKFEDDKLFYEQLLDLLLPTGQMFSVGTKLSLDDDTTMVLSQMMGLISSIAKSGVSVSHSLDSGSLDKVHEVIDRVSCLNVNSKVSHSVEMPFGLPSKNAIIILAFVVLAALKIYNPVSQVVNTMCVIYGIYVATCSDLPSIIVDYAMKWTGFSGQSSPQLVGILLDAISLMVFGTGVAKLSADSLYAKFGLLSSSAKGFKEFLAGLWEWIKVAIDYIGHCFGYELQLSYDETSVYLDNCAKAIRAIKEHKFMQEDVRTLQEIISNVSARLKRASVTAANTLLRNTLSAHLLLAERTLKEVKHTLADAPLRAAPATIYLCGPPATGKTTVSQQLAWFYSARCVTPAQALLLGSPEKVLEHLKQYGVYFHNATLRFWDDYKNEPVCVINEVASMTPAVGDSCWSDILQMCDSCRFSPPVADLNKMGQIYFDSKYIIMTSNATSFASMRLDKVMNNMIALRRRLDPWYPIPVLQYSSKTVEDIPMPPGCNGDERFSRVIDRSKIGPDVNWKDCFTFIKWDLTTGAPKAGSKEYTFDEMVADIDARHVANLESTARVHEQSIVDIRREVDKLFEDLPPLVDPVVGEALHLAQAGWLEDLSKSVGPLLARRVPTVSDNIKTYYETPLVRECILNNEWTSDDNFVKYYGFHVRNQAIKRGISFQQYLKLCPPTAFCGTIIKYKRFSPLASLIETYSTEFETLIRLTFGLTEPSEDSNYEMDVGSEPDCFPDEFVLRAPDKNDVFNRSLYDLLTPNNFVHALADYDNDQMDNLIEVANVTAKREVRNIDSRDFDKSVEMILYDICKCQNYYASTRSWKEFCDVQLASVCGMAKRITFTHMVVSLASAYILVRTGFWLYHSATATDDEVGNWKGQAGRNKVNNTADYFMEKMMDQNTSVLTFEIVNNDYAKAEQAGSHLFHIFNKVAVTTAHTFSFAKVMLDRGYEVTCKLSRIGDVRDDGTYIPYTSFSIRDVMFDYDSLLDKDLVLLQLPSSVRDFRDIRGFIPSKEAADWMLNFRHSVHFHTRERGLSQIGAESVGNQQYRIGGVVKDPFTNEDLNIPRKQVNIANAIRTFYPTASGDCGKPGFVFDPLIKESTSRFPVFNNPVIVGFHVCGNGSSGGIARVYREMFPDGRSNYVSPMDAFNRYSAMITETGMVVGVPVAQWTMGEFVGTGRTGLEPVGILPSCPVIDKSRIERGVFHNTFPDNIPKKVPAIMHPHKVNGVIVHPREESLAGFGLNPCRGVSDKVTKYVTNKIAADAMLTCKAVCKVLNAKEVVLGMKSELGDIRDRKPLKRGNKGVGSTLQYVLGIKSRVDVFGEDFWPKLDTKEAEVVIRVVEEYQRLLEAGVSLRDISLQKLKDEARDKNSDGNVKCARSYWPSNLIPLILEIMYFGDAHAALKESRIDHSICVGTNPYKEAEKLVDKLHQVSGDKTFLCADVKSFDKQLSSAEIISYGQFINVMYGDEGKTVRDALVMSCAHPLVAIPSKRDNEPVYEVHQASNGLLSGLYITSFCGSFVNKLRMVTWFMGLYARRMGGHINSCADPMLKTLYDKVAKEVAMIVYGDDSVIHISDDAVKQLRFNFRDDSAMYTDLFGSKIVLETEFLDEKDEALGLVTFDQVIFLRRSFRCDELGWCMPLALSSIRKPTDWSAKGTQTSDTQQQILDRTLIELSLHGEDTFNKYKVNLLDRALSLQLYSPYSVYSSARDAVSELEDVWDPDTSEDPIPCE